MKQLKSTLSLFPLIFLLSAFLIGCQQDNVLNPEDETTDQAALQKLVDEDEDLQSFEPSYDEESAMDFGGFGKTNTEIFPWRVGQRMRLIERNLNITFNGDTAYGLLTKTFAGILYIAASYDTLDPNNPVVDTLIQKEFTTVVTRNIIFEKIANDVNRFRNWRIIAISLPEGGTQTENIEILKLTAYLPNGDTLVITSPNDYYLHRGPGRFGWFGPRFWHQFPLIGRFEDVTLVVELKSAYEPDDFVTLTYGARRGGFNRAKKRLELVSSTFDGQFYRKVYQGTYRSHQHVGPYHAIINAVPQQVIKDDAAPVEVNTWGFPYFVR